MIKQILVGYDGSAAAQRALDYAFKLAKSFGCQVHVVYAASLPTGSPEAAASLMADPAALHPGLSASVAQQAAAAGVTVRFEVIPGSPGDVLLAEVAAGRADHLVIGNSGHGALARWLLGSVMSRIVERTQVPVTVVP